MFNCQELRNYASGTWFKITQKKTQTWYPVCEITLLFVHKVLRAYRDITGEIALQLAS